MGTASPPADRPRRILGAHGHDRIDRMILRAGIHPPAGQSSGGTRRCAQRAGPTDARGRGRARGRSPILERRRSEGVGYHDPHPSARPIMGGEAPSVPHPLSFSPITARSRGRQISPCSRGAAGRRRDHRTRRLASEKEGLLSLELPTSTDVSRRITRPLLCPTSAHLPRPGDHLICRGAVRNGRHHRP